MSKPSYGRLRRVDSNLQRVLAEELELLADPRLELVSITGVSCSADLRRAVVYYSTVDLSRLEEAAAGLQAAASRLRAAVGRELRMKFTPALVFHPDSGVVEGERIEAILRNLGRVES